MTCQADQFMAALEFTSTQLQLGAFYTLMEGIEKGVNEVSEITGRYWDGSSWKGPDQEFGALISRLMMLIIASERLQAPDFIAEAHQSYTDGLKKYLEFIVHAKKGKPIDADQRFRESSQLINKAISLIDSAWSQLGGN